MFLDDFTFFREWAVATTFYGQVHNHRAGLHFGHRFWLDEHWCRATRDKGGGDYVICLLAPLGVKCRLPFHPGLGHGLCIASLAIYGYAFFIGYIWNINNHVTHG